MKTEFAVKERYAAAAKAQEQALCCPVDYDPKYLEVIPTEVIERDYGCGDPSKYVKKGETVLDLGSGTGKICFIASQVVGESGKVIGVDMTDDMLEIARRNAPVVAERIGYENVKFCKGRIQDLRLDLELLEEELKKEPVADVEGYFALEGKAAELRAKQPLVESESVDVVVSNCVLNLVESAEKRELFEGLFRVLKRGGRAVISDIVSDEEIPEHLQDDAHLWSGCLSGAYTEEGFVKAFEEAGFHGIEILKFDKEPWQTVEGIEFRSITIQAYKGKQGPCLERKQAVIYKGPFKEVLDDDGHRLPRGRRMAVCDKTYNLYKQEQYEDSFAFIDPREPIALEGAKPFDCSRDTVRSPKESKGEDYQETIEGCGDGGCC